MNTKIKCIFSFAVGAAIGTAATWKFFKTKYELIAQEEIDSVKEVFSRRGGANSEPDERPVADTEQDIPAPDNKAKPGVKEYAANLRKLGYTDYSAISKKDEAQEEVKQDVDKPYVISPDEFGEFYDYEKIDLTYYSDGVLADENDDIVDDADNSVGSDFAEHFGDYEEDAVHIRNDRLKCDYEILFDHRKYSDVASTIPH